MSKQKILMAVLLLAAGTVLSKPNFIVILADDLGYGDLGVTGHPYAKSPNIDRLAKDGILFKQGYMCGSWCAPSRAALMSGVYPARYFNRTHELAVDRPSLTSLLKEAGYATAHFGKWHIGGKGKDAPTPSEYGIDEAFITNGNGPTWPAEARKDPHYREKTTPHYVNLTIDFMKRNREKPFFVNLCVYPTHSYINPTPEQLEVYKDLQVNIEDFKNPLQREFLEFVSKHGDVQDAMRAYCADVTALDAEVGRLLQAVSELGLDEKTMIIFSSDNGPGPLCGNWDNIVKRYKEKPLLLNNVGSAGPYRDRKASLHEGGTHVPFIVRWTGKVPAGAVNSETLFGGVDLLPSLISIVGAAVPEGIDGLDLSSALLGKPCRRPEPLFWNDRPGWSTLRDGRWKAHLRRDEFRLFDLNDDPSESENVVKKYPEEAKRRLQQLKEWEASLLLSSKKNVNRQRKKKKKK